jgi:hypothetical protein
MAKRYFVLACSLLQCLTVIGMDRQPSGELSKSRDNLRYSQETLSRSQELLKFIAHQIVAPNYYDGFCGNAKPVYCLTRMEKMPMPPHHHHSDSP